MIHLLIVLLLSAPVCRDRSCVRGRAVSSSATNPLATPCLCQQINSNVVVRGRTAIEEEGFVDFCSVNGSFDAADAGDFVACAANTPRVMAGAIYAEPSGSPQLRINSLLNASQFDNSNWVKIGIVASAPTVTADLAVGPSGTQTADFVTFQATSTGSGLSVLNKSAGNGGTQGHCPASVTHASAQVYARGALVDGGSVNVSQADGGPGGFFDLGIYDGAAYHSVTCGYGPSTFTRCKNEDKATGANGDIYIGNGSLLTSIDRPTQSVFLWGSGCEEGANVSSPIDAKDTISNGQVWTRMPDQVESISIARTAWLGDSLSANTVASTSSTQVYPRAPEEYATSSSRTVDNWAINGATFETDCKTEWSSWAARSSPQRVVFFCGINDIHLNGANGDTLWTDVKAFITGTIPGGTKVIVNTLLPFGAYSGWTSGQDTQRKLYNTDALAFCADAGAPYGNYLCCDTATAMWDPAAHTNLNPTWAAPDGLHLNDAGAITLGDFVWHCTQDAGWQ